MNHIAEKELASKSTKRKRYFLVNSLKQKKKALPIIGSAFALSK